MKVTRPPGPGQEIVMGTESVFGSQDFESLYQKPGFGSSSFDPELETETMIREMCHFPIPSC